MRDGVLPARGLYLDDAWVALVTKVSGFEQLRLAAVQAPGFALLLKVWTSLVGFSDLKAQLLPWAIGVATPALLFAALRYCNLSRLAAVTAALILATSPTLIEVSGRVKQYTLDALCATAIVAVSLNLVRDLSSPRRWWRIALVGMVGSLLSTPCAIITAGVIASLWAAQGLWDGRIRRAATVATGVLVVFLAWWVVFVGSAVNASLVAFWRDYYIDSGAGLHGIWTGVRRALETIGVGLFDLPSPLGLIVIAGSVLALVRAQRTMCTVLAAPTLLTLLLAACHSVPIGTGRTDVFLYPSLAVLVALGTETVRNARPQLGWSLMAAICLALLVRGGAPGRPYPSEDIQPLVAIVEHELRDGDVVLLNDGAAFSFPLYTSWPIRLEPSPIPATGFYPRVEQRRVRRYESEASIPSVHEQASRVWLVTSHLLSAAHDVEQALSRRGFAKVRVDERRGAALSLWTSPAPTDGLPAAEGRALTPGGNQRDAVLHRWWRVAS